MSDVRGTLLERNLRFVQERRTCNSVKERAYTFVREQMELANTNPLVIELDPSCSGQAHSDYYNRPGIGHGYESTEPRCILTVFRVPFTIRSMRGANAKFGKVV